MRNGDHEQAARVIEIHWGVLFRTDSKALQAAITGLPEAVFDEHPIVGLVSEAYRRLTPRTRLRGDRWLAHTVDMFQSDVGDDRLRLSAGLVAVQGLRRRGRYAESADLGRRVAELGEGLHDAVRPAEGPCLASVHLYVGLSHLLACDFDRAEHHLHTAYRRPAPFPNYAIDAAGKLAFLAALRGEHGAARAWIERADGASRDANGWWLLSQEQLIADVARALIAVDRLDWRALHDHTREALPFPTETWTFLLYVHARAALFLGNQTGVLDQLQRHQDDQPEAFPAGSLPRILLDTAQTDLYLSLGDYEAAEKILDIEHMIANPTAFHPLERTSAARLCILTRRYDHAIQLSDPATWPATITRRGRVDLTLLHATARLHQHAHHDDIQQLLRQTVAHTAGLQNSWLFALATADTDVINLLVEAAPEASDLVQELRRRNPTPPFRREGLSKLTRRERLILQHLDRHVTIAEIADHLHVSLSTVKNQCTSIYRKLGATSRHHALEIAYRNGILQRD